jgi:hypothetical protein
MSRWFKRVLCLLGVGIAVVLNTGAARADVSVTVTGDVGDYAAPGVTITVYFDAVVDGLPDTLAECTDENTTWTWTGVDGSLSQEGFVWSSGDLAWVDFTVPTDAATSSVLTVPATPVSASVQFTSSCGNASAQGSGSTQVTVCNCGS